MQAFEAEDAVIGDRLGALDRALVTAVADALGTPDATALQSEVANQQRLAQLQARCLVAGLAVLFM